MALPGFAPGRHQSLRIAPKIQGHPYAGDVTSPQGTPNGVAPYSAPKVAHPVIGAKGAPGMPPHQPLTPPVTAAAAPGSPPHEAITPPSMGSNVSPLMVSPASRLRAEIMKRTAAPGLSGLAVSPAMRRA